MNKNLLTKLKKNKKGFTLIELIVVIAILGILAAIAIPRFANVQDDAKISADAATAKSMVSSARIIDAQDNTSGTLDVSSLMTVPTPKTGGVFKLAYDSDKDDYTVTFGGTEEAPTHTYTESTALVTP